MTKETVVSSRPDREITKKITKPGDYTLVPFEDSRCKIIISDVNCTNEAGHCDIDVESRFFSPSFDGNILIGDSDSFLDRDFELILQQMCCGEVCLAKMVYRDSENKLVKEIKCKIELKEITEEQLICDWSVERLYEAARYHKERGVDLFKEKKTIDAFRRFNKSLKMLVAIEPIDPEVIDQERIKEMVDFKVKLYNNLAQCQLKFDQYEAALELCNKSLKCDPDNVKALYRRCIAYAGQHMYEEAWSDIQKALTLDPNDKAVQQKANTLKPMVEKINKDYTNVIKKMFS